MNTTDSIAVWDPLVRLFHWALAAAFAISFATGDDWSQMHLFAGYTVGGLVATRLAWGMIGPRFARFSNFVHGPTQVAGYLRLLLAGDAPRYLSHNPAGGAMIVLLLLLLGLSALTGIALQGVEAQTGPLRAILPTGSLWHDVYEESHEFFANLTLLLVAVHVGAVLFSGWLHGENLVRAMITGRKVRDLRAK